MEDRSATFGSNISPLLLLLLSSSLFGRMIPQHCNKVGRHCSFKKAFLFNVLSDSNVLSEWILPVDRIHSFLRTTTEEPWSLSAPSLEVELSPLPPVDAGEEEEEVSNLMPGGKPATACDLLPVVGGATPKNPCSGMPSSLSRSSLSLCAL